MPISLITPDQMLQHGLLAVGLALHRIQQVSRVTNLGRFRAHYGSNPVVYAQIWEDLQCTPTLEARLDTTRTAATLNLFLMTLHFLNCYPTEPRLAAMFRICETTARNWLWVFARKIQALKADKIVWPSNWTPEHANAQNNNDVPVFLVTVDGVHCRVQEPQHPTKSKDQSYYSHKFKQSGLNYELGLSVFDDSLVWMNGPFKASRHDITIFRNAGLQERIPAGHRIIGDRGYIGEPAVISTTNPHDPAELRKFKSRARARHESFNGRIKKFKSLDERFRHGVAKHKVVFEAICVICQYQMETGSPLFST